MTTYSTNQRFAFPVLDGDDANTLGVAAGDFSASTIHSDTSQTVLTSANSYVVRNATLSLESLSSAHTNGADLAFDIRNSTVYINADGTNFDGQLGTNIFENISFIRNGTGGTRAGIGRSTNAKHTQHLSLIHI